MAAKEPALVMPNTEVPHLAPASAACGSSRKNEARWTLNQIAGPPFLRKNIMKKRWANAAESSLIRKELVWLFATHAHKGLRTFLPL
jgi:hypothetical protein